MRLRHKALLWGMYVKAEFRGTGAADMILSALIDHARDHVEAITLTVVCENQRAVRFYERWGFRKFGVEPASVKLDDGTYLDEALMVRRLV
jgi:ribosomal protein S18 acetylase RimI-like enzyme